MKKILALSLTFALFACGGSHRSEADLVIDFKHKKEVFDMNWNSGKIDKLKLESDSTLQIAEEIIAEYPAAAEMPDRKFTFIHRQQQTARQTHEIIYRILR